jgi:hypothetical protein
MDGWIDPHGPHYIFHSTSYVFRVLAHPLTTLHHRGILVGAFYRIRSSSILKTVDERTSTKIGNGSRTNKDPANDSYVSCRPSLLSSYSSFSGIGDKNFNARGTNSQNNRAPPPHPNGDLAKEIKGIYRLLDLISESGSNGCGNEHLGNALPTS